MSCFIFSIPLAGFEIGYSLICLVGSSLLACFYLKVMMLFCLFPPLLPSIIASYGIWPLTFSVAYFLKNLFYFPEFLEWDEIQGSFSRSKDSLPLLFLCNVIKKRNKMVSSIFPSPPFILSFSLFSLLFPFCWTFIPLPVVSASHEGSILEGSTGLSISRGHRIRLL